MAIFFYLAIRHKWEFYPAVDLSASVSRVMNDIVGPDQIQAAQYFRRLISLYIENRDLILMGGYAPGQDQDLDLAVQIWPKLMAHIQQSFDQVQLMMRVSKRLLTYLILRHEHESSCFNL